MEKLKLLDLFCCAGGAGEGYRQAGFDVTGVDRVHHKRNPGLVVEADALSLTVEYIRLSDARDRALKQAGN